jgi:hypothetical protein
MEKLLFCILNLLAAMTLQAQEIQLKGVLCNGITKEPIPYATVHIANSKIYSDADENGRFEISVNKTDSLIISSIGFETLMVAFSTIVAFDSFFLKQCVVNIPEIIITKPIVKTFGSVNDKKDRSITGGSQASRTEVATLIEIPESSSYYRISKIFIRGKDFKDENPVRLHIYAVDSIGLPGRELLIKEIIIKKKEDDKKVITLDVKDQNIVIENNSFFVGIQWLTSTKVKLFTGPEIYETFRNKKLLTYRRQLNVKNNKWFGEFKKDMVFFPGGIIPSNDTPINILASAEIEVFEKQKR